MADEADWAVPTDAEAIVDYEASEKLPRGAEPVCLAVRASAKASSQCTAALDAFSEGMEQREFAESLRTLATSAAKAEAAVTAGLREAQLAAYSRVYKTVSKRRGDEREGKGEKGNDGRARPPRKLFRARTR